MKTLIRWLVLIVLVPLLWVVGNLLYGTVTDYQPPETIDMPIAGEVTSVPDSVLSILSWNIGYAGLGEESDFFYDGGETVIMDKELVRKNFNGIYGFVKENDSIDLFLLQEVDYDASRSHRINEYQQLVEALPNHASSACMNYNVRFVPVPFLEPMGRVRAGLTNFSRFDPAESVRYQYPSSYSWPSRIYFLDRCCLLSRYELKSGKNLVVINTHNSAYDDGGMKKAEMDYLKKLVLGEYEAGNYVVVGGDWNQCPPLFDADTFIPDDADKHTPTSISKDYLPGWTWAYDPAFPTNRALKKPFDRATTAKQLIDFFLLSPNLKVEDIRTMALHFQFSDHEPVYIKVSLK